MPSSRAAVMHKNSHRVGFPWHQCYVVGETVKLQRRSPTTAVSAGVVGLCDAHAELAACTQLGLQCPDTVHQLLLAHDL